MILEVSPESSLLVHGAATAILLLHITGGALGLVSGAAAIVLRKGSSLHRLAGQVFVVSMLVMAAIGAAVSPFLREPQWVNVVAGTLTFYLVATAWATARRERANRIDVAALISAVLISAGGAMVGWYALSHAVPASAGGTAGPSFVFASLAALAAFGDLRLLRAGSVSGKKRLQRHLWRMSVALLIAATSLFLGQAQIFPTVVRGTGLLFVPELAVLLALAFWTLKVRLANARPRSENVP